MSAVRPYVLTYFAIGLLLAGAQLGGDWSSRCTGSVGDVAVQFAGRTLLWLPDAGWSVGLRGEHPRRWLFTERCLGWF